MTQFLFILFVYALQLMLFACADHKGHEHGRHHPNRHFIGLFENDDSEFGFFVSHFCEERETKAIYWGSGPVDENGVEATSFVGRDVDGAEDIGEGIFQLSGETYTTLTGVGVAQGTWELSYDSNTDVYQFSVDVPGVYVDSLFPTKVSGRAHSRHRGGPGGRRLLMSHVVREEYRCFMPYGGPLNTEYPHAWKWKTVQSGQNRVGEDEKTDPALYFPTADGSGCYEWQGQQGVDILIGTAYEGRLALISFNSATATACALGSEFALAAAEDLMFLAYSCADGTSLGAQLVFELDQNHNADWHSCPIGP